MSRDRSEFTQGLDSRAYAVKVGGMWFAGFGNNPDATPRVKLRRNLCDAKLMVSVQQCRDYITRLERRGHPGGVIHNIVVVCS